MSNDERAVDHRLYDADPDAGTLDIVMCQHGYDQDAVTPARRWATGAALGDHVDFTRPQGNFVVHRDAAYHVFVGEETASVAFAAMLRSLRPPIFFKHQDRFLAELRQWPPRRALAALGLLLEAERQCKRTGFPDHTLCSEVLLRLARGAGARRR